MTDTTAQVNELPETTAENRIVHGHQFIPPLLCLVIAVVLFVSPHFLPWMTNAAVRFSNQPGYWHTVYTGATVSTAATPLPEGVLVPLADRWSAGFHGLVATLLALGLALSSVYRHKLPKRLRLGSYLETGMQPLRALQSGHPGDYVLWLTTGVAVFGQVTTLLLRR